MKKTKDSPGILFPPPFFYITVFLLSFFIQALFPIQRNFFQSFTAYVLSAVISAIGLCFIIPALLRFIKTKNSVITFRPATSLQTGGIYSITRNPMYLGTSLAYLGLAFIFGNWWTIFQLPLLLLVINHLYIRKEEKYLMRSFGDRFLEYKKKVRRWI